MRGFWITVLLVLAWPGVAAAQRMEAKDLEVGDKWSFTWTLNNKTQQIEEECTAVTNQEVQIAQKVGGRNFETALAKGSYHLLKTMCLSNGQQCTFSPASDFAGLPLERGKRWSVPFTARGETFTAHVVQERKVEKMEKVKVPAGEFEGFKVTFTGSIRGTDSKGSPFSGKEDGADWVTLINGKYVVVKYLYRNSFGEKATRELTTASFK